MRWRVQLRLTTWVLRTLYTPMTGDMTNMGMVTIATNEMADAMWTDQVDPFNEDLWHAIRDTAAPTGRTR